MNRRAFFGALAGAPAGITATAAAIAAEPEWVLPDMRSKKVFHSSKCVCGCPIFTRDTRYSMMPNMVGIKVEEVDACTWCERVRAI
jgi:hypothetical protein